MKAIRIEKFGGPEVMNLEDVPDPTPGDGEVLVEVSRCGVNFADTHATRNDYLAEQALPMIPGGEISGTDPDGRRVASVLMSGGYAQKASVQESWLVPVPDGVSDDQAAALLIQGITAHALVYRCARLEEGETVVVEAAAGGTGGLSVQLAKRAGAKVIALASTDEKRSLCEELGADATVDSGSDELGGEILAANGGKPVDAVLHMSGDRFAEELDLLAPFGRIVVFGNASRTPNEVATNGLLATSRQVIGFWLVHLLMNREATTSALADLFGAVAAGELQVTIGGVYPLADAAKAHQDLIGRGTQGKLLLDPNA